MHIFLVNDDGIGSKGIMALLRTAVKRGHHVSMCAPRFQQSAASHRFSLVEPVFAAEYPLKEEGARAWSIAGSPVDCVRVGLFELVQEPVDVLISGINDGYNAGMAVHYSGTVGAAMEGALNRVKSIAASIHHKADDETLEAFAQEVIKVAEGYAASETLPQTILNINAPDVKPAELKSPVYAPLSVGNFIDGYERRESPRAGAYYWLKSGEVTEEPEPGSDLWYLREGHTAYTILGNPACAGSEAWDALKLL